MSPLTMSSSSLPAHLADWTVLVNSSLAVQVNSLLLATNSKHFYEQFKKLEDQPAERVSRVDYEHPNGLLLMLELIGCRAAAQPASRIVDGNGPTPLGPDNLTGLVRAAIHFQAPRMLDLALSVVHSQARLENCWSFWRAAVQASWHPLRELVQSTIAAVFQPAAGLPGFLELTEGELLSFLRHRELNISSELDLLEPIERWLDGDCRRPLTPATVAGLLGGLQLARLSPVEARAFERCPLLERCGQARAADLLAAAAATAEQEAGEATPPPFRVPHEIIFVCGGWEGLQNDPNFGPSDAVQVYNYQTRTWIRHSQPPGPVLRCGHAYSGCVLLHHCVYIVGGYVQNRATGSQGPTSGVKEYDLRRRVWRLRAPMHHQRNYVSAAPLDGFVYAVGGHNGRSRLNTAERFCPRLNRWQMIAPMQQVRSDAGCAGMQHHIYVCGGFNGHQFFSSVERYDPAADQWTYVAAMLSVRSGVSVCECEGQLYALGGNNGNSRLSTVERYDPELEQWTTMPPMLTQRSNFSAALLRGDIYAVGGWSDQTNTTVSVVEKWRPSANSAWELAPNLLLPASANCCCSVVGLDLVESLLKPTDPPQLPAPPPPPPPPPPQQQADHPEHQLELQHHLEHHQPQLQQQEADHAEDQQEHQLELQHHLEHHQPQQQQPQPQPSDETAESESDSN